MDTFLALFAVVVTVIAGWAMIKRYQTHMVLLFAGLAIFLVAICLGDTNFLPKNMKPSGFVGFDVIDLLRSIGTKQSAGTGFIIMTAGGFAATAPRRWSATPANGCCAVRPAG